MNETLMIQIKASVEEALKKIEEVQKELSEVGEKSKKSSKTMEESMKSATRSAQLQVEAIKQVVSQLINLGKSSLEAQKEISRLNAAFESSGSNAAQAGETYKNIFGFLGDSGAAVEAAQQLANITPDTAKLKEYEAVLQGVYAKFGTSIETGGLAEGINHTIQLGEVQGTLADAFEFSGISVESVNAKLATLNSTTEREVYLRSLLIGMYGTSAAIYAQNNASLIAYNQSQANLNVALAEAGTVVLPLMTAFNNLAAVLLTTLKPALEVIVTALVLVIQAVSTAIGWISSFFSVFSGSGKAKNTTKDIATGISSAANSAKTATGGVSGLNKALDGAAQSAKELKKQTMGFDELNIVSKQPDAASSSASSPSVGGGGVDIPMPDLSSLTDFELPSLEDFLGDMSELEGKIEAILVLVGSIGAAFALWKLTQIITDAGGLSALFTKLAPILQTIGGVLITIAGAILLVEGYSDAWVNGIDWENFALIFAGLAGVISGIAIAFGSTMAGVVAFGAGLAVVALAIKDIIENGLGLENLATLLIGITATVGGLALAFSPMAAAITAVVAGLGLFVLGVVDAIKNGDSLASTISTVTGLLITLVATWYLFNAPIALVVTGILAIVAGITSFINQGPTLQNTILILSGAIAIALAAATGGLSLLTSLIIGAGVAIGAFITSIVLEEEAILSVTEAQEALTAAKEKATEAENTYINAIDNAEASLKKLEEAERKNGISGKELYEQVQAGTLDYKNMTAQQREVYKAYLDNEKKQKDLKTATEELSAAKRDETLASFDNQLAIAAETGNYDAYKASVIQAYKEGKLSADDAREAIEKSMSKMSDASQKTFMEDLPADLKKGMDPHEYESTGTKMKKWFSGLWTDCKNIFSDIGSFFSGIGTKLGNAIGDAVKSGINGIITLIENTLNKGINLINGAIGLINKLPGVSVGKISRLSLPRLAKGGIVDSATVAMIGEAGKEAVIPLENNTEWMDKLAERLAEKTAAPSKIVLTVDGKELGWANIHAINDITKQTGNLPLVIA